MEPPPGGPLDVVAPLLLATRPESLEVLPQFDGAVEFQFDETVSEGGRPNYGFGDGDLEKLVMLSPSDSDAVPVVRWRRHRITVRPREGWQPNRAYRVELQSGVNDLRNNRTEESAVVTFTTGSEIPTHELRGSVVDWTTNRPIPRALIEATLLPDSLTYRTLADSVGDFTFGPLPDGAYLVRGVIDQNRNRQLDRRELYDTVRVARGVGDVGDLWAFRHDTLGPRIEAASQNDSLSILVTFTQELMPGQQVPLDSVTVRRASDSTVIIVSAIMIPERYDTLYRTTAPPPDSVAADSTQPPPAAQEQQPNVVIRTPPPSRLAPRTSRPPLDKKLVLRLTEPLRAGEVYLVDMAGVRNPNGASGGGRGVVDLTAQKAISDSTRVTPDSTAQPDSTRRPPDSLIISRR